MIASFPYFISYAIMDVFCIIVAIIVSANVQRDSGSETQVRFFYLLITAYQVFTVTDLVWALFMFSGLFPNNPALCAVVNGINKIAVAFTGYFWFCYTLARFNGPLIYNRSMRWGTSIPIVLVLVVYVLGYFLGSNAIVNADGTTSNGPTYFVVTAVALLYLLSATIFALRCYHRTPSLEQRRTTLVFVAFMIAPMAGATFDAFVPDTPIMAPSMLISILLVLMSLQDSRISSDALTGLNNRRRADAFLDESLSRMEEGEVVYLFLIDLNRFKAVNDTYGHLEGDHALKLMASALRETCVAYNAFAARWGGDEFVMICAHNVDGGPQHAADTIKKQLLVEARDAGVRYDLSCSVGFACCDHPSETCDQLIKEADQALYMAKKLDQMPR